jgi:hypothetical protein
MVRHAWRTRCFAAATLLGLLLLPKRVLAQAGGAADRSAPELELEWVSPPECDARQRTIAAVERLLGSSPGSVARGPLSASATVTGTANGDFHLLLIVQHGDEQLTRKLEAPSCVELSDAAALILALVLDPELLARGEPTPTPNEAREPSSAAPPAPEGNEAGNEVALPAREARLSVARAKPARVAARARLEPFVELGPVASWGVIPSPALGVSLSGGFDFRSWRVSVTGAYFPSRHAQAAGSAASAAFELRTIGASLCYSQRLTEGLRLGPCLLSDFGSVAALGEGVDAPQGDTKRWGSTGLAALLRYASRRAFELGVQASLQLPWGRPEYWLAGSRVYDPSAVGLGLRGFVGVRF